MKRRDKPHPPLSSPTDLSIRGNRRLANLQEKNDKMTYIDFHFTTFSPQPNSLNGFLLSHSTPEYQLALPIVVPPFNLSYTFSSDPDKETDTDLGMNLSSMPKAEIFPNCQPSGKTEHVSSLLVQVWTRLIDALSPRLDISFELICKSVGLKLRFKAAYK